MRPYRESYGGVLVPRSLGRTEGKLIICIHVQHAYRGATDGSLPHNVDPIPHKVALPLMTSRVEQFGHLIGLRINTCQIRAFVQITINTRQGKIVASIGPAVLPGDDVLDMERGKRCIVLMQLAVFAAIASPLPDKGLRRRVHRLRCGTK